MKVKSINAKEIYAKHPEVKKKLWGGEFGSDGYFVSTVGKSASEDVIANYFRNQGKEKEYIKLHIQPISEQLSLF